MTEPVITPFASVPGLATIGSDDAGMCVDGVCAVPSTGAPSTGAPSSGGDDGDGAQD